MSVRRLTIFLAFGLAISVLPALVFRAFESGVTASSALLAAASLSAASATLLAVGRFTRPLAALSEALETGDLDAGPGIDRLPPELRNVTDHLLRALGLREKYDTVRREVLDSLPDPFLELDRKGRIVFVNEAALTATGYNAGEVLGRPCLDFVPAEWKRRAEDLLGAGSGQKGFELTLVLRDGRTRFFEFNSVPLKNGGLVTGCFCIGRDSDERKRLLDELTAARGQAGETSRKLKKTISDLEEFALLAIRRELKMQELRERFVQIQDEHDIKREFPA